MEYNNILLEEKGQIAVLTINRPKALNALSTETIADLNSCLDYLETCEDLRVVIVTGSGEKSFVAGADIAEMSQKTPAEALTYAFAAKKAMDRIENLPFVTIAAVNGFALGGGCELSMCCDIRIAAENAVFGQPETGLGITPGFGGTQRLARLVGKGRAKELIFTASNIKVDEAYRIGLVNKVVPKEELMEAATKMAEKIAGNAPFAISQSKAAINSGLDMSISDGVKLEAQAFAACFSTADQKEGMQAFLEKRPHAPYQGK